MLCEDFFLLLKNTTDPNNAITTAKAIAKVPKLPNATPELAREATEDEPDVIEVGRRIVVAVVLESLVVVPALTVLDRFIVLLGLPVPLIKIVDAGKLSSIVATPDGTLEGPLAMKTK
jgi:hypothetical protein